MRKTTLNFIIDVIMFILMALLIGIGLLIKYTLISGAERWEKFGRNVDLSFLGFDRHEWGKIHLIIALLLIAFLILHLIFHWKQIVGIYRNIISGKNSRLVLTTSLIIVAMVFISLPVFVTADVQELAPGRERFQSVSQHASHTEAIKGQTDHPEDSVSEYYKKSASRKSENKDTNRIEHSHSHAHEITDSIEIKGYMTLSHVATKHNIPEAYLKNKLKIPASIDGKSKLGHLRKKYGFTMSEIRSIIVNYNKSAKNE